MKRAIPFLFVLLVAFVLAACGGNDASVQQDDSSETETSDYPSSAIRVIVPYGAGGGTDLMTRPLVAKAEEILGVPMRVENITGGAGGVGMTEGANAEPDGYTLTTITVEATFLPHLGLVPFSYRDFEPIMQIAFDPATLSVRKDAPYQTIEAFIEYVKEHPGEVRVGNGGAGGIWHLATAALEQAADIELTPVAFDSGAEATGELLGGHIEAVMLSAGEHWAQIESGDAIPLAVMANERLPDLPDVPTFREIGIEVEELGSWKALAVPAGTPAEIIEILTEAFVEAGESEEFVTFMKENALNRQIVVGEEFKAVMEENDRFFGELIPSLNLQN